MMAVHRDKMLTPAVKRGRLDVLLVEKNAPLKTTMMDAEAVQRAKR